MSDKHKAVSFSLGRVVATPGALAALEKVGKAPIDYLQRHAKGDWGEALCEEDKQTNAQALKHGTRLLSAYLLPDATKLWIITDGVINRRSSARSAGLRNRCSDRRKAERFRYFCKVATKKSHSLECITFGAPG